MPDPKLTVIVASYNYEQYLSQNLRSLINQWQADQQFNVLVVDDGSSDDSLQIAQDFAKKYSFIEVITHEDRQNKGLCASLQLGLRRVTTDWIAFLESDDVSRPGSMEIILKTINQELTNFFFFDIEPIIEKGASADWFNSYVPRIKKVAIKRGMGLSSISMDKEILRENFIPTFSCVVLKKNLLEQCSFNCPVPGWIDWFLWIQVAQQTKVRFINEKLVFWRIHNTSQNNKKNLTQYLIQYRIFRLAVRKRLLEMDVENKFSKISFLSLPVIIPLGIRFFKMARYTGFRKVIKQIYGRLVK